MSGQEDILQQAATMDNRPRYPSLSGFEGCVGDVWCREGEELLASAGPLLARGRRLPAGLLEATRVRDANLAEPSKAVVQSVQFHPDGQVLMTAGLDKRLRFFQVRIPCASVSCLFHFTLTGMPRRYGRRAANPTDMLPGLESCSDPDCKQWL